MKYLAVVILALVSITLAAPNLRADPPHKIHTGFVLFKKALEQARREAQGDDQSDVQWFRARGLQPNQNKQTDLSLFKKEDQNKQTDFSLFKKEDNQQGSNNLQGSIPLFKKADDLQGSIPLFKKADDLQGSIPLFKKADDLQGSIPLFKKADADNQDGSNNQDGSIPLFKKAVAFFKKRDQNGNKLGQHLSFFKKSSGSKDPNEVCRFESQQEIDPELFNFCCKKHSHILTVESMMLCALASW